MKREIRRSEKFLLLGFSLILLFMIVQDWVPLAPLNDVQAIANEHTFDELLVVTLIGVGQFALLLCLVLIFVGKRYPIWIRLWLIIHPSCIFTGALMAWYIPYFFGFSAEEKVERYERMFGETHTFLPIMNGIVPNTFHMIFHLLLLTCILISVYISVTMTKKEGNLNTK